MRLKASEQIKIYCDRLGVNYTELGRRLGVSPQNVSQLIKKGNFRENDLEKIADALGLDLVIEFREKPTDGTP